MKGIATVDDICKTHTSGREKAFACVIVYKSVFRILAFLYTLWYDVSVIYTDGHFAPGNDQITGATFVKREEEET